MKKLILLLLIAFVSFSCMDEETRRKNEEASQIQFDIDFEKKSPSFHIDASGTYRKRLLHSGYEINLEITNKAKYTTYKDFIIEVSYYTKTKSLLHKERLQIFEVLKPMESLKIDKYTKDGNIENAKTLGWGCVEAKIVK